MNLNLTNWFLHCLLFAVVMSLSASNVIASPVVVFQEESDEGFEGDEREDDDDEDDDDEDDKEEEEEDITFDELMEFAKKRAPKVARMIKLIIEEEGETEEVVEFLLERGSEMIRGYWETTEVHGQKLGEKFLELFTINVELEMIPLELEESDLASRSKIKKHLKELISKRYSLELMLEKAELRMLKSEIREFEQEIKDREENREEIIEEQLDEFLEEIEGEEEAEDDDDDDDDDEDEDDGDEDDEDEIESSRS